MRVLHTRHPDDEIDIVTGDTGAIANGVGTIAAHSAVNAGSAVHVAGKEVRQKAILLAANMLKVSPEKLQLKGGFVYNVA